MTGDTEHHESCPLCEQRFLGFTDADMLEHLLDEHPDRAQEFRDELGLPTTQTVTCPECWNRYTTHMGGCPWCQGL